MTQSPVPDWVQDAVFYQIFPDRFMNGDTGNDPPVTMPWNATPTPHGFHGGDLRGILQRLDYLVDLGITALYLNPIFLSPSNHRYNTVDYYQIDPMLGTMQDFRELVDALHARGMRLVLDGVFNHCGRGFYAFSDVLENQQHSPYIDWFHIRHFPVDAYGPGEARDYLGWWNYKSLPKFNTANPKVRAHILRVAGYWIEQGADGWRLDVPNEIDDDAFWAEFRRVVRAANPEAYLVGEIWDALPRWVGPQHFDGLMNYPLRAALLGLLASNWSTARFAGVIDRLLALYPQENTRAMFNLLGSHDTERVLTLLSGDPRKAKLAAAFQFAFPGAPSIYYGDEVGMLGGKDPDCRGGFPWDERLWNSDLRDGYRRLIAARRQTTALRRGTFIPLVVGESERVYAFARRYEDQAVAVAINAADRPARVVLPAAPLGWADGREALDLLSDARAQITSGSLTILLSPWQAVWLA